MSPFADGKRKKSKQSKDGKYKKPLKSLEILKNMDKLVALLKVHSKECPKFAR
jgi:hypothetical protein